MMSFAFVQDVPANETMYAQIKELLPDAAPAGLVVHLAVKREGGLRYIDVWETEAHWDAFRNDHVEPAVEKVLAGYGIPHTHDDVVFDSLDVVDVWLGA
jgi:hypothetical protein